MPSFKKNTRLTAVEQQQLSQDCCRCQLLSLSGVGDSDCSCSDCLEIKIQAYKELMLEQQEIAQTRAKTAYNQRYTSVPKKTSVREENNKNKGNESQIGRFKSVDRLDVTRQRGKAKDAHDITKGDENWEDQPGFSKQCINDYMKITQQRAKKYMDQLKSIRKENKQERSQLKSKIKDNLMKLDLTVKSQFVIPKIQQDKQGPSHLYKWNHMPYHCCPTTVTQDPCCLPKSKYQPNLQEKHQQIQKIKQRIRQYKLKLKDQNRPHQCEDKCPNHHMRTSKETLAKIQAYIRKKAKALEKRKARAKKDKQQASKLKQAKLRAIDIKCKQIVNKSKKYDPNASRTSFHNSVDHFSTFSQLRQHKKVLDDAKANRKNNKVNKQSLTEALYDNIQFALTGEQPTPSQMPPQSKIKLPQDSQEYCFSIVRDAKIAVPKNIKPEDAQQKKKKEIKQPVQDKKIKEVKREQEIRKQQKRRKQLELEIQKRKSQILNQYRKRKVEAPGKATGKQLREQYEKQHRSSAQQQR